MERIVLVRPDQMMSWFPASNYRGEQLFVHPSADFIIRRSLDINEGVFLQRVISWILLICLVWLKNYSTRLDLEVLLDIDAVFSTIDQTQRWIFLLKRPTPQRFLFLMEYSCFAPNLLTLGFENLFRYRLSSYCFPDVRARWDFIRHIRSSRTSICRRAAIVFSNIGWILLIAEFQNDEKA